MTTSLKELAKFILALDAGEKVERLDFSDEQWVSVRPYWAWSTNCEYRIVKPEPKLVPHWPAIVEGDGCYYVTDTIFPNELAAGARLTEGFVRLATECPPIMLPETTRR